jgi:hypothetical protein
MTAASSFKTMRTYLRRFFSITRRSLPRGDASLPDLLGQRLRTLEIDPRIVAFSRPDVFVEMTNVCASCSTNRRCFDDLTEDVRPRDWESYCANFRTISTLH